MVRVAGLGCAEITVGRATLRPEATRAFVVALYLAEQRGRRVGRDALATLVWAGEPLKKQRHNLRQVLYTLRRAGMPLVEEDLSLSVRADAVTFDWEEALTLGVDEAVRRFREPGDARVLPDYHPGRSSELQEWLDDVRGRAEARLQRRLVHLVVLARREGRWEEAERIAYACLALDPLNEEATLTVAEAAALSGSKSKALKLLDRYLAELGDDAKDLRLPAETLRRRISERVSGPRPAMPARTKLFGRADLMATLTAALHEAKAGRGSAHLLHGPSGIGKTRLLDEVADTAVLLGGFSVVRVEVVASGADAALRVGSALAQRALTLFGSRGADPSLVEYCRVLAGTAPTVLGSSGSLTIASPTHGAVGAVAALFVAASEERPVLVVADAGVGAGAHGVQVLEPLARSCANSALLVLASCTELPPRPSPPWLPLQVAPLDRASSQDLFRTVAAVEKLSAECELLVERANGHPLFIAALARDYVAQAHSRPARTLAAVLGRQLSRADVEARRVLEVLACAEGSITPSVACAVLEITREAAEAALAQLSTMGLVLGVDMREPAVHDLVRGEVLAGMGDEHIARTREAIARVLLRSPSAQTPVGMAQIYHYLRKASGNQTAFSAGVAWAEALLRTGQVSAAIKICQDLRPTDDPQSQRKLAELYVAAAFGEPSAPYMATLLARVLSDPNQFPVHPAAIVAQLCVDWARDIDPDAQVARCKSLLNVVEERWLHRKLVYQLLVTGSHTRRDDEMLTALAIADNYLESIVTHEAEDCEIEALCAFYTGRLADALAWAHRHLNQVSGLAPFQIVRALVQLGTIESHCDRINECTATMTRARNIALQLGSPRPFLVSTIILLKVHKCYAPSYADAVALADDSLAAWVTNADTDGVLRRYLIAERLMVDVMLGPSDAALAALDELTALPSDGFAAAGQQEIAAVALWGAVRLGELARAASIHQLLCSLTSQTDGMLSDVCVAALAQFAATSGDRPRAAELISGWASRWPGRIGTVQIAAVRALLAAGG